MELFESYGNLNKIHKSLLNTILFNSRTKITPDSEVYVDKLKSDDPNVRKHTWKYLTDVLLEDPSIYSIIIRSNKRQLLMIKKQSGGDYMLHWSDIGADLPYVQSELNGSTTYNTHNDVAVRNKISKTVESFINSNPNAKKNWDVLIIKVDDKKEEKQKGRKESRFGMEYKPQNGTNAYINYINDLKSNLTQRLIKYSESKLLNIQNNEDMVKFINNRNKFVPQKIKILNNIWLLEDSSSNIYKGDLEIIITYKNPFYEMHNDGKYGDTKYLKVALLSNGRQVELKKIGFTHYNSYNTHDMISFDEGIEKIIEYINSKKQ